MSVKSKVKRCNKEIGSLKELVKTLELTNKRLRKETEMQVKNETIENILKFAITNHIGGLNGGIAVERMGIDKMKSLRLNVEYKSINDSYIITVHY